MFDKDADFTLFFHTIREEAGGTTGTGAAFHVVTHHTNGNVHFVLDFRLRGGDGIQARGQRAQQLISASASSCAGEKRTMSTIGVVAA